MTFAVNYIGAVELKSGKLIVFKKLLKYFTSCFKVEGWCGVNLGVVLICTEATRIIYN